MQKIIAGPGVYICNHCIQLCVEVLNEDRVALTTHADERTLLDNLRLAGRHMRVTDQHLRGAVGELRRRGKSWRQIGDALGISRQAAWERFSGEE